MLLLNLLFVGVVDLGRGVLYKELLTLFRKFDDFLFKENNILIKYWKKNVDHFLKIKRINSFNFKYKKNLTKFCNGPNDFGIKEILSYKCIL